ncbi:endonuclease domain-containing 1 protein-like [Branchiostoma lanceolatum]|uniref:endonuclease domain-containing 1 protein-like n=1 Tax=Branchiostoma lanceolatum TaxID=7740 RepID=UPI0034511737
MMDGHSRKLVALGLLGVAAALICMPSVAPFKVDGELESGDVTDIEEDGLLEDDFVYRSRSLKDTNECSLHDKPKINAPVQDCLSRCSNHRTGCRKFFAGTPWPPSSYGDASTSCRICQTQENENKDFFATLYSTKYRIPEYTAAAITRDPKSGKNNRPSDSLWNRIQPGLCSPAFHSYLRKTCKYEKTKKWGVTKVPESKCRVKTRLMKDCGDCQALHEDLVGCGGIAERGHINPNKINNKNKAAQEATFSMINMAPQAPKFNRAIWKSFEHSIMKKAEEIFSNNNNVLYVITGTKIGKKDKWVNGRVLFPRFFWKAVCYTGDEGADPFGVGVYGQNNDTTKKEDMTMLRLSEFDKWLYGVNTGKHIFQGSDCEDKEGDNIEMATPNPKPKKTERGGL